MQSPPSAAHAGFDDMANGLQPAFNRTTRRAVYVPAAVRARVARSRRTPVDAALPQRYAVEDSRAGTTGRVSSR
jgi:hypothetical protein